MTGARATSSRPRDGVGSGRRNPHEVSALTTAPFAGYRSARVVRTGGRSDGSFRPAFPLVEAKLSRPGSSPAIIDRPRLTRVLSADPPHPVVTVIAPPGYGKTVLLANWASIEPRSVAWLTLDEFDNTPSVFLTYVAAALDRVHAVDPSLGATLAVSDTRILAAAVPRLASELHRWPQPGILVLDDVHRLTDRRCLDALAGLVEHLPPGFQVVLGSRAVPDLPLGRLRANRALGEIGRDELAFDADETRALAEAVGHRMTAEQARALAEATEGWAAAIYLATLGHSRADGSAMGPIRVSGRDGYIADYLRSELRPVLDDRDVTVLTRTSILDVVAHGLAEEVSGEPDATDRLRRLSGANLLIDNLAGEAAAFRYHHLLREHLEAELERNEPGARSGLHRRAAAWYEAAGQTALAIEHAIAGGDTEAAARMVEATTLRTYLIGQGDRLSRWLATFDDQVFARQPTLAMGAALVHGLSGRPESAERMADIVERSTFDGVPINGTASFESARAILRASMVRHGPDDALANASEAVAAEGPGSPWRTLSLEVLAQAWLMHGDVARADTVLGDAIAAAPPMGGYAFYALGLSAAVAMGRGDWAAAERFAHESRVRLDGMASEGVSAMLVHAVAARVALHHGDARGGREELVRAQLLLPLVSHALPVTVVLGLLEMARGYLAAADPAGAGAAVSAAESILRVRPDLGVLAAQVADLRHRVHESADSIVGPSTLTPAELRLLPMLSTYLMFQDIADRMGLSKHTVKTQAVSIYGKLGASSRADAVDRAIEVGLLEPFSGLRLTAPRQPR
jgi:LuxR family maltose regulon positive regulatory protein